MNEEEATSLVATLYDSLFHSLVRYAVHLGGSVPVAEETVQEAFFLLYRSLRSGQPVENPRAWAFTVVRRNLYKNVKEPLLGRIPHLPLEYAEALPSPGETDPLASQIEADDLGRLLAVLTPREREVLILRVAALKYREIGDQLGISLKSVHTMVVRALCKLRKARQESAFHGRNVSHVEKTTRPLQ